jgi:hypothetical protein
VKVHRFKEEDDEDLIAEEIVSTKLVPGDIFSVPDR